MVDSGIAMLIITIVAAAIGATWTISSAINKVKDEVHSWASHFGKVTDKHDTKFVEIDNELEDLDSRVEYLEQMKPHIE